MLSVKQREIKYHFLSLWYDWIGDRTPGASAIGEHSNHNEYTFLKFNFSFIVSFSFFNFKVVKERKEKEVRDGKERK